MNRAQFQGTCPVCFGVFKVLGSRLSLHGYQRPGDGYIHGRCFGVDFQPWEISSEGTQAFVTFLERELSDCANQLRSLQEGLVQELRRGVVKLVRKEGRSEKAVTVETVTPIHPEWAAVRDHVIFDLEGEIRHRANLKSELELRIAGWKKGALQPAGAPTKWVELVCVMAPGLWVARSVESGKTLSKGKTAKEALANVRARGWDLPEGVEVPAEPLSIDAFRSEAAKPEKYSKSREFIDNRKLDPTTSRVIVAAFHSLTAVEQAIFNTTRLGSLQAAAYYAEMVRGALTPEKFAAAFRQRFVKN